MSEVNDIYKNSWQKADACAAQLYEAWSKVISVVMCTADRRQEMQQMRGVKRPHDAAPAGWPGDTKRPATSADYPPNAARYAYVMSCIRCNRVLAFQHSSQVKCHSLSVVRRHNGHSASMWSCLVPAVLHHICQVLSSPQCLVSILFLIIFIRGHLALSSLF